MKKTLLLVFIMTICVSFLSFADMTSDSSQSGDGMKSDKMMKSSIVSGDYELKGLGPHVVAYTSEKDAQMLANSQKVVYFFAASWCPDCQATYADIKANFKSLPENVTIVFVNYDHSSELKKKYGITMQHTFVLVDSMGKAKKLWSGTTTVAAILKNALAMM